MTSLSDRKTAPKFKTSAKVWDRGKYRSVCVDITPYGGTFRLEGLHTRYAFDWAVMYESAVKVEVERVRNQKRRDKALAQGKPNRKQKRGLL